MNPLVRQFSTAACLSLGMAFAPLASATVLTFDDIGHADFMPANYGGLDWSASLWRAFESLPADGTPYTPHSGTWAIAADFGSANADTSIGFAAPAHFDGAWFSGYDSTSVSFSLYLGGHLVGTSASLQTSALPQFLAAGYSGLVDKVIVTSNAQAFYAMDDFTYQAAPVPEPESLVLMWAGLGLVGFVARRRR